MIMYQKNALLSTNRISESRDVTFDLHSLRETVRNEGIYFSREKRGVNRKHHLSSE